MNLFNLKRHKSLKNQAFSSLSVVSPSSFITSAQICPQFLNCLDSMYHVAIFDDVIVSVSSQFTWTVLLHAQTHAHLQPSNAQSMHVIKQVWISLCMSSCSVSGVLYGGIQDHSCLLQQRFMRTLRSSCLTFTLPSFFSSLCPVWVQHSDFNPSAKPHKGKHTPIRQCTGRNSSFKYNRAAASLQLHHSLEMRDGVTREILQEL